ncbi:hypothetical protein [Pseudofrankia sp. DC12]|uniref:hypothetical protein n=1 Tax=Pseudofrankia sp. DC12 TaxID=683315 RepID=UPI0006967E19|nr:hypothetical protein [Pseudofrankia sp. DC12]
MAELVDLIVRQDGDTWAAWSPRCPGLAIIQVTESDLVREARSAVREYLADPKAELRLHVESEVRGVVFRVCQDEHQWARHHVVDRLAAVLGDSNQAADLAARDANALGDVVFVCAMPTDTLDWVERQMEPGDALNMAISVADALIWVRTFRSGDFQADDDHDALPTTTTIAEVMRLEDAPLQVAA